MIIICEIVNVTSPAMTSATEKLNTEFVPEQFVALLFVKQSKP